jgi:hypothetical protein
MTSVVRWVEVHWLAVAAKSGRFEAAINWECSRAVRDLTTEPSRWPISG